MDLDKQQGVPTLASRVAGLRKRMTAKLETNAMLAGVTGRNKGIQKTQISRPELLSSSFHLPDPSIPFDSNIPPTPTPLHPDTSSFDPIAPSRHDRRPRVPGCIINRAARSHNWSHATNATLEMVSDTEELGDSNPRLTRGQELYRETRDVQRNRVVRYNEREGRLQPLSRAEQDRYEREQQNSSPDSSDSADSSPEKLLGRMFLVNDTIEPETTREIIRGLEATFSHIPFTIIGGAAIVHHGLDRTVWHVSMACSAECAPALFSWAKSVGMHRFRGDWANSFGYPTSDGFLCRVRVRRLRPDTYNSRIRAPRPYAADRSRVMTLPNIVNEYACEYAEGRRLLGGRETAVIAEDILWMLGRVAARRPDEVDQAFVRSEVTWIFAPAFWGPFTAQYPEAIDLFRDAGVFRCLEDGGDSSSGGSSSATAPPPPPPPPVAFPPSSDIFEGMCTEEGKQSDLAKDSVSRLAAWTEYHGLRPADRSAATLALQSPSRRTVRFVQPESRVSSGVASPDRDSWTSAVSTDGGDSIPSVNADADITQVGRGANRRLSDSIIE